MNTITRTLQTLLLLSLTLFANIVFQSGATADDSVPAESCRSIKDQKAATLCTATLWCPDCGLNKLRPSEFKLQIESENSLSLAINTKQMLKLGRHQGTGHLLVPSIMKNYGSMEVCPQNDGYIVIDDYKTTECVTFPNGKAVSLEMSNGLKRLLKTIKFDSISFSRSNGLNKNRPAPYTLLLASLRIKKGQTLCGIKFDEDTVATLNTFENDHKIAIRPPKPIVIGGKTYPAWVDDSQVYEIFDGEKCANDIRFLKASE